MSHDEQLFWDASTQPPYPFIAYTILLYMRASLHSGIHFSEYLQNWLYYTFVLIQFFSTNSKAIRRDVLMI